MIIEQTKIVKYYPLLKVKPILSTFWNATNDAIIAW